MNFFIADTFTDSLAGLTAQEQKAVKTTAFDLQMDPSGPGMSFHRIDRARDPNFWSVRVNRDIRLIVHRTSASLLLAYVDHHDDAYKWAERRKLEAHPETGAMQLVEIRELVEDATTRPAPDRAQSFDFAPAPAADLPPLFDNLRKAELMSFGVPAEWVDDVRQATEATLFEIIHHLPQEAQEALLQLAVGETPAPPRPTAVGGDPFSHPDAARRFRLLTGHEELERALEYPWEKWTVFLHPEQRRYVERDYNGPARVSGSAGTGKTIVALHRAVHLARRDPEARVLLATFSTALANALRIKLGRLVGNEPVVAGRITVAPLRNVGLDLYTRAYGAPTIASPETIRTALEKAAAAAPDQKLGTRFLLGEWSDVVDAWQIRTWEAYRGVQRLGRKTRIGERQREVAWAIFESVRTALEGQGLVTWPEVFGRVTDRLIAGGERPFDVCVVDEAQDIGVAEARFLSVLGDRRVDALFFAGDLGQRIFQAPFSWKSLGIDVRGRSATLRINYRTSHQIRTHAERLLPQEVSDLDGNAERRTGTISVFDGVEPEVRTFQTAEAEAEGVGAWIAARLGERVAPHEIGVFVRSPAELDRAHAAVRAAGAMPFDIADSIDLATGNVAVGTMHLAKGLEFRAVAVMACDDEVVPLQERVETVGDETDLEEVYVTERHLLYVACTRAREWLILSGVDPASEFFDDFRVT